VEEVVVRDWDPAPYAAFRDLRLRPALDLLAQVPELPGGDVVDLGCGDGAVGPALAARFKPDHHLIGVDASSAMLEKAAGLLTRVGNRLYSGLTQADIGFWAAHTPAALIFSNAALHWLADHASLMPRLVGMLAPGGVLAVQMPAQFQAPSHALLRRLAGQMFPDRFDFTSYDVPVHAPETYHAMLSPFGHLDIWTSEYLQELAPQAAGHPVRAFTQSTAARPILDRLDPAEEGRYLSAYDAALEEVYPRLPGGGVLFPFRRLFFVLQRM
jgi:trans-aconitate 2-methyltransferase